MSVIQGLPNRTNYTSGPNLDMGNDSLHSATPPQFQPSDYGEIILLSILIMIGAPLNLVSLFRTLSAAGYFEALVSKKVHVPKTLSPTMRRRLPSRGQDTPSLLANNQRGQAEALQQRRRSSTVNPRLLTFKLHLTSANLLIVFGYGFSQLIWLCTYSWRGGDILCKFTKFLHTFCFYATSNLVASIAIDRLRVTIHVDRPAQKQTRRLSKTSAIAAAASHAIWLHRLVWCAWLLAMVSSLPQFFLWRTFAPFQQDYPDWNQCVTVWMAMFYNDGTVSMDETSLANAAYYERIYGALHLALVFWIPVCAIIICYTLILFQLHRRIRRSSNEMRHELKNRRESEALVFRQRCQSMHRASVGSAGSVSIHTDDPTQHIPTTFLMELPIVISSIKPFMCQQNTESFAVVTLTKAKRRTVKATVWILLAYMVCWSPYNILELYRYLIDPEFENMYLQFLSNLIVLNAVVNPMIYRL